jgi:hypothetical protein
MVLAGGSGPCSSRHPPAKRRWASPAPVAHRCLQGQARRSHIRQGEGKCGSSTYRDMASHGPLSEVADPALERLCRTHGGSDQAGVATGRYRSVGFMRLTNLAKARIVAAAQPSTATRGVEKILRTLDRPAMAERKPAHRDGGRPALRSITANDATQVIATARTPRRPGRGGRDPSAGRSAGSSRF